MPAVAIAPTDAFGGGDAEHQPGRREDAVVRAEDRGAQPASAAAQVALGVGHAARLAAAAPIAWPRCPPVPP